MKKTGFKIDGYFIPLSYDTNNDKKLSVKEVSIFCRDNDLKYNTRTGKITPATDDCPIADNIYNAVSAKKYGIPTTNVSKLTLNIKNITSENIEDIMFYYEEEYGQNIFDAINNEWLLKDDIKNYLIKHLNQCSAEALQTNCKIDEDFKQGKIGDCWLLASIAAVRRSPKGQEILNNMITDNKNGTYTVKFPGEDEKYTIDASEVLAKSNYSNGDIDVRILEIAAQKHYNIMGIENGGNPDSAIELLTGSGDFWKNFGRNFCSKPTPKEIKDLLDKPNIIMTASISPLSKLWGLIVKDVPEDANYKTTIGISHSYAIVGIDDENIHIQNPWNTSKIVKVPLEVFEEYWGSVQYTEIK